MREKKSEFDKWVDAHETLTDAEKAIVSKIICKLKLLIPESTVDENFNGSFRELLNEVKLQSLRYQTYFLGELCYEKALQVPPFFYQKNKNSKIWWVYNIGEIGRIEFSFDRKKIYNLYRDYPKNLTAEEKEIFDKENSFWKKFRA